MTFHERLYAMLRQPECPQGCSDCCCPVPLTPDEADALGLHGKSNTGWDEHGNCQFLGPTGCTVYDRRPFTCRAFGCAQGGMYRCGKLVATGAATMTEEEMNGLEESYFTLLLAASLSGRFEMDPDLWRVCAEHDRRVGLMSEADVAGLAKMLEDAEK